MMHTCCCRQLGSLFVTQSSFLSENLNCCPVAQRLEVEDFKNNDRSNFYDFFNCFVLFYFQNTCCFVAPFV